MATSKIAIDIAVNTLQSSQSLKELKDNLKGLEDKLFELEEGSAEFNKLSAAIGEAKKGLKDLNEAKELQTLDGKFKAFADLGAKIGAGFELASSTMALFGQDTEEIEKALKKAQAAMMFVQGIKELEGLGGALKNAGIAIKGFAQGGIAALRSLWVAMLANPITAILVGLTALGGAIAFIVTREKDDTAALRENIAEREKQIEKLKELQNIQQINQNNEIKYAKAQNKSLEEIRELEDKHYIQKIEKLKKASKETGDLVDKQRELVATLSGEELEEGQKKLDELLKAHIAENDKYTAAFVENAVMIEQRKTDDAKKEEERLKEKQKTDKEAYEKSLELQKDLNKQLAQARIDNIDDDREKAKAQEIFNYEQNQKELQTKFKGRKELNDLLFELEMKHKNALSEIDNNFNIAEDKKKKEREDKAKAEAEKKRQEDLAGIKKDQADQLSEYETRIKTQQRLGEDSTALELEAAKYKLDTILNDENASYEQRLAAQEEYNAKVKELDDKAAANKQAIRDAEVQLTYDSLKLIGDIATNFAKQDEASQRKAFEINKKVQLAMATIDMIRAVQGAYKSAMDSPLTSVFPAFPYIQAAMAAAYGLMNIRKIQQTQFQGGGGAAGGMEGAAGGAGGAMSAPLQGGVNNTSTMLENLGQGQQEQKPIKAYVLQTDVASEDQKVKAIENKSKIE